MLLALCRLLYDYTLDSRSTFSSRCMSLNRGYVVRYGFTQVMGKQDFTLVPILVGALSAENEKLYGRIFAEVLR